MTTVARLPHSKAEPDFIPPTISDARYGWGLSIEQLLEKLDSDSQWKFLQDDHALKERIVMYTHTTYGYGQCWDFDQEGKMYQVRLLILPDSPHLVGAFLLGSTSFGNSWIYLKEMTAHPDAAPELFLGELEGMTVLQIVFHGLGEAGKG